MIQFKAVVNPANGKPVPAGPGIKAQYTVWLDGERIGIVKNRRVEFVTSYSRRSSRWAPDAHSTTVRSRRRHWRWVAEGAPGRYEGYTREWAAEQLADAHVEMLERKVAAEARRAAREAGQ